MNKLIETMNVNELRAIAKERGLKGYSRMRKDDLVRMLIGSQSRHAPLLDLPAFDPPLRDISVFYHHLLDTPVNNGSPILLPTKASAVKPPSTLKNKFNEWFNWLVDHIPQKRKIDEALESFINKVKSLYKKADVFELEETKSALKKFTTLYTIHGKGGYDPLTFLKKLEPEVSKFLMDNRSIKVEMILNCMMGKTDIKNGEEIFKTAPFHS